MQTPLLVEGLDPVVETPNVVLNSHAGLNANVEGFLTVRNYGTGPLEGEPGRLFVARFDASGAVLAADIAKGARSTSTSDGNAILATDGPDVLLGGSFYGPLSFGPAQFDADYTGTGILMRFVPK